MTGIPELNICYEVTDKPVFGFKRFNPDWTCREFQYEVGHTYTIGCDPMLCERGFHFCLEPKDCYGYYPPDPGFKTALVVGNLYTLVPTSSRVDSKCVTKSITILKDLTEVADAEMKFIMDNVWHRFVMDEFNSRLLKYTERYRVGGIYDYK